MTRDHFYVPRSSFVGFEQLFQEIERISSATAAKETYPPHNIIELGENQFAIELAVAGFAESDLTIQVENDSLVVSGEKEDTRTYAHRGISSRKFSRSFRLADHVVVKSAELTNGILVINVEKIIPEEKKPRKISIGVSDYKPASKKQLLTENTKA
jgi:molecular chaperone IbpA